MSLPSFSRFIKYDTNYNYTNSNNHVTTDNVKITIVNDDNADSGVIESKSSSYKNDSSAYCFTPVAVAPTKLTRLMIYYIIIIIFIIIGIIIIIIIRLPIIAECKGSIKNNKRDREYITTGTPSSSPLNMPDEKCLHLPIIATNDNIMRENDTTSIPNMNKLKLK